MRGGGGLELCPSDVFITALRLTEEGKLCGGIYTKLPMNNVDKLWRCDDHERFPATDD